MWFSWCLETSVKLVMVNHSFIKNLWLVKKYLYLQTWQMIRAVKQEAKWNAKTEKAVISSRWSGFFVSQLLYLLWFYSDNMPFPLKPEWLYSLFIPVFLFWKYSSPSSHYNLPNSISQVFLSLDRCWSDMRLIMLHCRNRYLSISLSFSQSTKIREPSWTIPPDNIMLNLSIHLYPLCHGKLRT